MNFVNCHYWVLGLFLITLAQVAKADPVPFTETSNPVASASGSDTQAGLISELKHQAVLDWLKNYLGSRFANYEKNVTREFSERYILDYKVSRATANRSQIELTGHLDGDGLKAWIRVSETKARGNASLSPFLVLSSTVPGLTLGVNDTAARLRDSVFAQTILSLVSTSLQRFNIRVSTSDLSRVQLKQPARSETEMNQLREQSGNGNSALWLHFSPCKTACPGMHLDTYLYNLNGAKILIARADDINLAASDIGNSTKIRQTLKATMSQLATDFDGLIGSGVLQSNVVSLSIEGVDSYRAYKAIDSVLDNLDYVTQSTLKAAKAKNALYEILTPLTMEELSQRFNQQSFNGFTLKPVRVDSRTLIVRYLKQP